MCGSCVTSGEVVLVGVLSAGSMARSVVERVADRRNGRTAAGRRLAAHQANAVFLRSLGHDPDRILGPAPTQPPAPSRRPARPASRTPQAGALLAT